MRHANSGRKLGRSMAHRKALMRNLATALFTHGRIRTTETKAKELSRVADQMITLAKDGGLHARRQALGMVFDVRVIKRLFSDIAPWYTKREGGYTRVLKLEPRPGDNAPMAFIELVDRKELGEFKSDIAPKKPFKNKGKKKETAPASEAKKVTKPKAVKAPKAPKAPKNDKK